LVSSEQYVYAQFHIETLTSTKSVGIPSTPAWIDRFLDIFCIINMLSLPPLNLIKIVLQAKANFNDLILSRDYLLGAEANVVVFFGQFRTARERIDLQHRLLLFVTILSIRFRCVSVCATRVKPVPV